MNISYYFMLYILYSILGWLIEVILYLYKKRKFINRGFLIGPYCPIYGKAALLVILLLTKYVDEPIALYVLSIFICSLVEYTGSFILEKIFKTSWWDYSNKRFNINGRICLETMLPFGVMGTLALYFLQPKIEYVVSLLSNNFKSTLVIVLCVLYLFDNLISFKVMKKIKIQIKKQKCDNTNDIKSQVTEWIYEHSFLYRHIIKAFPHFKIIDRVKSFVTKKDVNKE